MIMRQGGATNCSNDSGIPARTSDNRIGAPAGTSVIGKRPHTEKSFSDEEMVAEDEEEQFLQKGGASEQEEESTPSKPQVKGQAPITRFFVGRSGQTTNA
jgi:hypothetical protein